MNGDILIWDSRGWMTNSLWLDRYAKQEEAIYSRDCDASCGRWWCDGTEIKMDSLYSGHLSHSGLSQGWPTLYFQCQIFQTHVLHFIRYSKSEFISENNLQWCPIKMIIFHKSESCLLCSLIPSKTRSIRVRMAARRKLSF